MAEDNDELEYRKRIEEERAKLIARYSDQPKKSSDKYENKVKKVEPKPVSDSDAAPVGVDSEKGDKAKAVADEAAGKAAAKAEKKEASDVRKEEEKQKKELIGAYEARVKVFAKTRTNRDAYWTDKDWSKREFWDRKSLEKRQKKLYKKQIQYMWKNSSYMRARMEGKEILKTGMVKKPEDIVKLPFITNSDLAASQRQDPPFGNICSAKAGSIVDIGVNGEASAAPRYFFTASADVVYTYRYARPLLTAGITGDDVVVLLGEDDFWAVNPLCEVLKHDFGCTVICVAYLDAKRRMEAITQLKATVLIGTPSQAQSLADAAGVFGMDAAQTAVRLIITGGEAGIGSSPETGSAIEQAWNAKAYEFYGCQDVGILAWSCDAGEGLHLMEDDYIFEILDPVTGQPVPTGAEGELVVTPLLNMTVPVTRYRTRDIVSVVGLPCTCRRTMTRIVIKRKLTEEPAITIEEPPQEEDVEPEPELVAVGAGVKETEAEAEAGEAGSEPDTGYEEPAESEEEPKPEHEPEPPVDPEVTGDPDK